MQFGAQANNVRHPSSWSKLHFVWVTQGPIIGWNGRVTTGPAGRGLQSCRRPQRRRRKPRGRACSRDPPGSEATPWDLVRLERSGRCRSGCDGPHDSAWSSIVVLTDLAEEDYQEYYNGYANRVLWPILHYRLDLAEFSRRDLSGYMRVNQRFATELNKVLQPDDIVWVHDYHLLPLAKALRDGGHRNRIGFFHHIPFPPPEILTALPNHEHLIPAMIHYDLIGFQTGIDAANFARYLRKECGMPSRDPYTFQAADRTVRIGIFPVGVETAQLNRLARRAVHSPFVRDVVESLAGRVMTLVSIAWIIPKASRCGWKPSIASSRPIRNGAER